MSSEEELTSLQQQVKAMQKVLLAGSFRVLCLILVCPIVSVLEFLWSIVGLYRVGYCQ